MVMFRSMTNKGACSLLAVCTLSIALFFMQNVYAASTPEESASVGHIQFMIGGDVTIQRGEQVLSPKVGAKLYQQDQLITGDYSFIQAAMIDGALISVRPQSHLNIDCYQAQPSDGQVCLKFSLIKGQVRKVSGQAGKSDPSKYRLNTPVAAIGIRGTDFVASVQGERSLLQVIEGAITVTPFVESCSQAGFGACQTSLTATLTQFDTHLLEVFSGQAPRMVGEAIKDQHAKKLIEPAGTASSGATLLTQEESRLQDLSQNTLLIDRFIEAANSSGDILTDREALQKVEVMPSTGEDLVFGTWNNYFRGISKPYLIAKEGREITVGDASGGLWRSAGTYAPPVGQVNYALSDASASYIRSGQSFATEVTSGEMSINFDAQKLTTKMDISVDQVSQVAYQASHDLNGANGVFVNNTSDGRIGAGAISNDGKQVGYMLTQPLEGGVLNAATLWQSMAVQPNGIAP